ncbi:15768_t:CDS:2, partial [Gigaspora rosea]
LLNINFEKTFRIGNPKRKKVTAINTPAGSIAVGDNITITWSYTPSANVLRGTLSIVNSATRSTVVISNDVTLSPQSYTWTVNVPAGTYFLALDDGTGDRFSGTFQVIQGSTTAAAPSDSHTASAPAPSGAASSASSASGSPAAKAPAPAASSGPQAPSGASPPAQPQSSSNNIGIYIGIALSGVVGVLVGVIFSYVGYRAYKKHQDYQDSKFIPTPGNA